MGRFDASDLRIIEEWKKRMKDGAVVKLPEKKVSEADVVGKLVVDFYKMLGLTDIDIDPDVVFNIIKEELLWLEKKKQRV